MVNVVQDILFKLKYNIPIKNALHQKDQLDGFPQSEHIYVAITQINKQSITSILEVP